MIGKLFWMVIGGVVALRGRRRAIDAVDQLVPPAVQRQIMKQARRVASEFNQAEKARRANAPINVQATAKPKTTYTPPQ